MGDGMLSLSWNNHHATFCDILKKLRKQENYTDVTLSCEGMFYPLHKFVLSTCSEYFEKMFERTPCKHPVIVLSDIKCRELDALLSYMYAGAVNVPQANLSQLINAAEILQIKGLAVPDTPPDPSKAQSSNDDLLEDRGSPARKRRRTSEKTLDTAKTSIETGNSEIRAKSQEKERQMSLSHTPTKIEPEKRKDHSTADTTLEIGDIYHDPEIKVEVTDDDIDSKEDELIRTENADYDPQLAPFKNSERHFNPEIQIENDVSSGPSKMIEWQDGILETDMTSCEAASGVAMLQPSSPMLSQHAVQLAQQTEHIHERGVQYQIRSPCQPNHLQGTSQHQQVQIPGARYRRCKVCYDLGVRKMTRIMCSVCGVSLCQYTCFESYHTIEQQ